MKKTILFLALVVSMMQARAQADYITSVTFPAGYQVGDYVEFVQAPPIDAGSSGYFEISISYTRNSVAAAATHLASISHSNPALWREVGRINDNPYTAAGYYNFTIDCNTEYANPRFRVRAVNTLGVISSPLTVNIKVHSINNSYNWTALNATGNDQTVTKFLPMTNEWNLYVGNDFTTNGANLAIKAIENGNVGIGTNTPDQKLSVNGTIHAKSVLVDLNNWPDYVFTKEYQLPSLEELKTYIDQNHHLQDMPSAETVEKNGINLGEMNKALLKKVEELTLYIIRQKEENDKKLSIQQKEIDQLKKYHTTLTRGKK